MAKQSRLVKQELLKEEQRIIQNALALLGTQMIQSGQADKVGTITILLEKIQNADMVTLTINDR